VPKQNRILFSFHVENHDVVSIDKDALITNNQFSKPIDRISNQKHVGVANIEFVFPADEVFSLRSIRRINLKQEKPKDALNFVCKYKE